MSKALIKSLLRAMVPETFAAWQARRARAHSHRLFREWGLSDINARLVREVGTSVLNGPFAGVVFPPETHAEHIGPYLLGTYEHELHPLWESLFRTDFRQILDIGSKCGYYAVGLARRYPRAAVTAFDIDAWARRATQATAVANHVTNLTVAGACSPAWLQANLVPGAFVISDCEGYERVLFAGAEAQAWKSAYLLIETHEKEAPGVTQELEDRFRVTHTATRVGTGSPPSLPSLTLATVTPDELARSAREVRSGPQEWLLFTPRTERAG